MKTEQLTAELLRITIFSVRIVCERLVTKINRWPTNIELPFSVVRIIRKRSITTKQWHYNEVAIHSKKIESLHHSIYVTSAEYSLVKSWYNTRSHPIHYTGVLGKWVYTNLFIKL